MVDGFEELEHEIVYAKAETLGRMGLALEEALARLRAFDDGAGADRDRRPGEDRERLLARAGEALLFYVVQREAMGLVADRELLDELGVPREVRRRMTLDPFRRER